LLLQEGAQVMMRVVLDTAFSDERFAAARAQGGRLHYIAVAALARRSAAGWRARGR
jgi:tRNA 5-methylaminomethyl-2-thiouridine biosynthesis bifunctional protein